MTKQRIQVFQIIVMIILFQFGGVLVIGVGRGAHHHSWVALLIGALIGILQLYFCIAIYTRKQGSTFLEIINEGFGRYLGSVIAFMYCGYFLYMAAGVTSDFSFFIENQLAVPKIWIIKITILLLVGYVAYLGIEALARSAEIFFFITIGFLLILGLLFCTADIFEVKNLRPVLHGDGKALLKTVFPLVMTVPFGEVIVFLGLFHYINDFKQFKKTGWLAVTTSGIVLAAIALVNYGVLSRELLVDVTFPFIVAIQHISFLNFLTHFELLALVIFMFSGIVKASVYFFAAMLTLGQLFRMSDAKKIIMPLIMILYLIAYFFMSTYIEHVHLELKVASRYVYPVFQYYIPTVLMIILLIKTRGQKG